MKKGLSHHPAMGTNNDSPHHSEARYTHHVSQDAHQLSKQTIEAAKRGPPPNGGLNP